MKLFKAKNKNKESVSSPTFISYSTQNQDFAAKLASRLRESGVNIWFDQFDVALGTRWDEQIEYALTNASKFILILSKASMTSSNVHDEFSIAKGNSKDLIPILIEDCDLPIRYLEFKYLDFRGDFELSFKKLLKVFDNNSNEMVATNTSRVSDPKLSKEKPEVNSSGESRIDDLILSSKSESINVFISYSHKDQDTALAIRDVLTGSNIEVTIDRDNMLEGEEIKRFISESIKKANVVLTLISNKSLKSGWVGMETFDAMFGEAQNGKQKLVGCVLDSDFYEYDYTLKTIEELNEEIEKRKEVLIRQLNHDVSVTDISSEIDRLRNLRQNFPETMKRLKDFKCIDVSNDQLIKKRISNFADQLKSRSIFA